MNLHQIDQARRLSEVEHYARSGRFRAYCCGCISGDSNSVYVCLVWSGLSFYFAILAFWDRSPFYSYPQKMALIAFGVVNLLFGIVTFCNMSVFLSRMVVMRIQNVGVFGVIDKSKRTVFAITANALAVLISTLVCFILFVLDKKSFDNWCIGSAANHVKTVYIDNNPNSTVPTLSTLNSTLTNTMDAYNCDRLFLDEVKWSFLCLIVMFVVYIHWILIIAARSSYNFYRKPPVPPMSSEFSNVAPSKNRKNKINIFNNMKPAESIWKDLLVHKQYERFENGSVEIDPFQEPTKPFVEKTLSSNNTEITSPKNAFLT